MANDRHIVVIGAGVGGLTAAALLLKAGQRVTVLEAQAYPGGWTYEEWTGRPLGMVGGFAQESILKACSPWTGLQNVWLVGDSVFPVQSTAGVTLSGLRVARKVLQQLST